MNVWFTYMYRDWNNYKNAGSLVLSNPDDLSIDEADERIRATLDGGDYFIASQVGVPDVFFWDRNASYDPVDESTWPMNLGPAFCVITEADHCWHEYEGMDPTVANPTTSVTLKELVEKFESVKSWAEFELTPSSTMI